MRVNARFDSEAEKQLQFLTQATGMGVSDVLRASVEHYYRAVRARSGTLQHLSALVGSGDSGQSNVSTDYKRMLGDSLSGKHGIRHGNSYPAMPASGSNQVHEPAAEYNHSSQNDKPAKTT